MNKITLPKYILSELFLVGRGSSQRREVRRLRATALNNFT